MVTGSNGLIGSEVCLYFATRGFVVHGLDNNQRAVFFGPARRHALESEATRADTYEDSDITSWTFEIAGAYGCPRDGQA